MLVKTAATALDQAIVDVPDSYSLDLKRPLNKWLLKSQFL